MRRRVVLVLAVASLMIFIAATIVSFRGLQFDVQHANGDVSRYYLEDGALSGGYLQHRRVPFSSLKDPRISPPVPLKKHWILPTFAWTPIALEPAGPPDARWETVNASGFLAWRVPVWPGLLLCSLFSAFITKRAYRSARAPRLRCCLHCGYSLIGNTSGVCPECGTKAELQTTEGAAP
jgi:hypothetical protein